MLVKLMKSFIICISLILAMLSSAKTLKISMVTDVGGVYDQSFNQSCWEGLLKAKKKLGVKISYKESLNSADYYPNLETLVDVKNDLIWGVGFLLADDVIEVAKIYPEQKFAIIDYSYETTPKNIIGILFKAEQSSFLVGYIAGKMTKTKKVGFIGGVAGNIIDGFHYGFLAGVKQANPNVKVLVQYADSFTNAARGKTIAKSMYQQNADIIFHAAGALGDGVIEAAKEQNKWAIGVDRDQSNLAPENVLTSAMKRVDIATYEIVKELTQGKFRGGETLVFGLKDGGVDIAPTSSKHVPSKILKEVKKLKQAIITDKIVVPYNKETFTKYKFVKL